MNNRDKFLSLVVDNELDRFDLSEMLKAPLEQVDSWLLSPESAHYQQVPDMAVELLELKLRLRAENPSEKPTGE